MSNPAIDRLLEKIGDSRLLDKLNHLPPTDLQSLLLEVFRRSAGKVTPQQLLKAYEINRFVTPSVVDPITFYKKEIEMLELAKSNGFEPLELSPLAPLGSCSAIGLADQNKIISAGRGTEVVADATNLMALEAAIRRKQSRFDGDMIHLCSVHRHVRAQAIPKIKGFTPHFKVFTAVTAGRDTGSLQFEKTALLQHLSYYKNYFVDHLGIKETSVIVKALRSDNGNTERSRQMFDFVRTKLPGVQLSFEEVAEDKHRYYQHTRFSLNIVFKGTEYNLGDGGFVDWGSKLTSNAKERMFTSGAGIELLVKLMTGII